MVVMVGVDVHKSTHTAVAVDDVGRELGQVTVRATDAGHRQLIRWAQQVARQVEAPPVRGVGDPGHEVHEAGLIVAVEDCRHVSGRLERALLGAAVVAVRVPPKLMAQTRTSARTRGKSDPIDALAIARAALREPDLPRAEHTHASREIKLLADHRTAMVVTRTQLQSRLRWHLHELDPEVEPVARGLNRWVVLNAVQAHLDAMVVPADQRVVHRLAVELVTDIRALTQRINDLQRELADLVAAQAPQLLGLPGCGVLTAATVIAETANPSRFRSEACFAMHAGVAPIPASSGKTTGRHRLARGGNRQLNSALYMIAITQARLEGPGKVYYQRRRANGDSTKEALRALKRRIARAVYRLLTRPPAAARQDLSLAA